MLGQHLRGHDLEQTKHRFVEASLLGGDVIDDKETLSWFRTMQASEKVGMAVQRKDIERRRKLE